MKTMSKAPFRKGDRVTVTGGEVAQHIGKRGEVLAVGYSQGRLYGPTGRTYTSVRVRFEGGACDGYGPGRDEYEVPLEHVAQVA